MLLVAFGKDHRVQEAALDQSQDAGSYHFYLT